MPLLQKRLGDLLVDAKLITPDQLAEALATHRATGSRIGDVLVELGMVSEEDIAKMLARQLGVPHIDVGDLRVDREAAKSITPQVAKRYRAVPVAKDGTTLTVAMSEPLNVMALDDLRLMTSCSIRQVITTEKGISKALQIAYGGDAVGLPQTRPRAGAQAKDAGEEAPAVRTVNQLIDQAISQRASDIHIEPMVDSMRVRYRIDGMLRDADYLPLEAQQGVISRIKIMGGMDISEKRLPQDGRVEIKDKGRDVDLRVSSLPAIHGEKIVIRVLDKSKAITKLEEIGLLHDGLTRYRAMTRRPFGIILVTGPTGSGKTTTLMATLREINSPALNIITVEDPVEYQIPGVNQVQVNEKAGLTFAGGLRSILRQDPNVIMVGEIRDGETADIAIRAALTGHLVLSTVHTNEAAGTVSRLLDMGVEPFLVASSLAGVVAQRLGRGLCQRCREPYHLADDAPERFALNLEAGPLRFYRARGCGECSGTGYRGRIGLFEVMSITPAIRAMVTDRASADTIRTEAQRSGMRPLIQDGIAKALEGLTTLEEVQRVAYTEEK
ncbi:MAG: GspE/PulE family protein [Bacillota bacterium]